MASGPFVNVIPATLSGVVVNSGLFTTTPITTISGISVIARQVTDKSGYTLSASGLDTIPVESGMNFRQAQSIIAAGAGGQLSGAGTSNITLDGANVSGTNRVTANCDASGNRSIITLTLPT